MVRPSDAPRLATLKIQTFTDTYGPDNEPEHVEDHLAEAILSGKLTDGDTVVFDIDKDGEIVTAPERELALIGAQ